MYTPLLENKQVCSACLQYQEFEKFTHSMKSSTGFNTRCKLCIKDKKYVAFRKCQKCKMVKISSLYNSSPHCRDCKNLPRIEKKIPPIQGNTYVCFSCCLNKTSEEISHIFRPSRGVCWECCELYKARFNK